MADWVLVLYDGNKLPVHSPMLAFSTDLFHGMLAEGLVPKDNTLALEDANVNDVLALLRFTYEPDSLTPANFKYLAARGRAASVIRLAHRLGSRFVPILVSVSTDRPDVCDMPTLANVAAELGNDAMLHACFKMAMGAARQAQSASSVGAALDFIRQIGLNDNPVAEAALLSLLAKSNDVSGSVCATLLDKHFPKGGIVLVVEWNGQQVSSNWVRGDGIDYQIIVNKVNKDAKDDEPCINVIIKATPDVPSQKYTATVRLINPLNVASSPVTRAPCDFSSNNGRVPVWIATTDDLERCVDENVTSVFTARVEKTMN
jgi:hypothetical protein